MTPLQISLEDCKEIIVMQSRAMLNMSAAQAQYKKEWVDARAKVGSLGAELASVREKLHEKEDELTDCELRNSRLCNLIDKIKEEVEGEGVAEIRRLIHEAGEG